MRENRSENSEIYAEDISFSTKIILFWKILIGKSKRTMLGILGHNGGKNDTKLFSFRLAEAEQRCST